MAMAIERLAGRGRQPAEVEAARDAAIDQTVIRIERTAAWRRVHRLGQITHTSAVVGRPDWAEQAGAELQRLAAKQLRMLGESGGNAS
jgi:hypothetical protein